MNDPHRGRGGRYRIDELGNRVPLDVPAPPKQEDEAAKKAEPAKTKRSK